MKQPKKLTNAQKRLLSKRGYNASEYMYCEEDEQAILVINKTTKEKLWIEKG